MHDSARQSAEVSNNRDSSVVPVSFKASKATTGSGVNAKQSSTFNRVVAGSETTGIGDENPLGGVEELDLKGPHEQYHRLLQERILKI